MAAPTLPFGSATPVEVEPVGPPTLEEFLVFESAMDEGTDEYRAWLRRASERHKT